MGIKRRKCEKNTLYCSVKQKEMSFNCLFEFYCLILININFVANTFCCYALG